LPRRSDDEELSALGERRDTGGDVDIRAEVVAFVVLLQSASDLFVRIAMLRWATLLVPLLGCGLMCFGGAILATVGIARAARGGSSEHTSDRDGLNTQT
jgi:hypothetical protein